MHSHSSVPTRVLAGLLPALCVAASVIPAPAGAATTATATDTFQRTMASGWGTADTGGAWVHCSGSCTSLYSVASGVGAVSLKAGQGTEAQLKDYASTDTEAVATVSSDQAPTGGGTYAGVVARGNANLGYRGKVRLRGDGSVGITLERVVDATGTTLGTASLPAGTFAAGGKLNMRVQATGVSPTTLKLKVWKDGSPEPTSWSLQATDASAGLQQAGPVGLWSYISGTATNAQTRVTFDNLTVGRSAVAPPPPPPPATGTAGARLPITYSLSTLSGTVRYVSPSGSDSIGTGSSTAPFQTLVKAESVSAAGDTIVLRGGTYPIANNATHVDRTGLRIIAYPGELPVFDGSIAAPATVGTEGSLKFFPYQPMPGGLAEGVTIGNLPPATFSNGVPTGATAERGWRCVSGSSYSVPSPTSVDPDGCAGAAVLITGHYPDQVWVNGTPLQQVADKGRVKAGTFWLSRSSSTDAAPPVTSLYLHESDAADMSRVRVSSSKGQFLAFAADGAKLEGVQIQRHSPGGSYYGVNVGGAVDDFLMRDVRLVDNHGVSLKLSGGDNSDGSRLVRRPVLDRLTIQRSSFMGSGMVNTADASITNTLVENLNYQREFSRGPVSGALKAAKTMRLVITDSVFRNNWSHTLWLDQSNYDSTFARNTFVNNAFSSVLMEISHGLTLANNFIQGPAASPGDSGHSTVRISGSSGVKIVNNTILGGPIGVGVFAEGRSKKYDSNGDGTPDRPCSEHTVRYGQGGNAATACNVPYTSDFNFAQPGAYSPSGKANQTPGMNWLPEVPMLVNNVIANQTGPMASGWTPCGGYTPVCVYGYVSSPTIDVALNTVFPKSAVIDGNIYQTSGSQIMWLQSRGSSAATGTFRAANLTALKGSTGFGSTYFGLAVEANGRSGPGYVNADGTKTTLLTSLDGQAAPVPVDAKVNKYVPAGSRSYGYRG